MLFSCKLVLSLNLHLWNLHFSQVCHFPNSFIVLFLFVCLLLYSPSASLSSYVEVSLLPDWLFMKSAKGPYRTTVIDGTVTPFYGEEFHL